MKLTGKGIAATAGAVLLAFTLAGCKDDDDNAVQNQQPVQQEQGVAFEQPVRGDSDAEKTRKREQIRAQDNRFLAAQGYRGSVTVLGEGRNCEADGTVTGNWKGTATSMSYQVQRDGNTYNICIDHSGQDSRPALGSGPVLQP